MTRYFKRWSVLAARGIGMGDDGGVDTPSLRAQRSNVVYTDPGDHTPAYTMPRVWLDSSEPANLRTMSRIDVEADYGGDVNAALAAWTPGHVVVLEPYRIASREYAPIRTKANLTGSVCPIVSKDLLDDPTFPQDGHRVWSHIHGSRGESGAGKMARVLVPTLQPMIGVPDDVTGQLWWEHKDYYFGGIECVWNNTANGAPNNLGIVSGAWFSHYWNLDWTEGTEADHAYNMARPSSDTTQATNAMRWTVSRCAVWTAPTSLSKVSRSFTLAGGAVSVVDCDFYDVNNANAEGQNVGCFSVGSTGPYKIVNNALMGGSENIMFGGAGGKATNNLSYIPEDVEIRRNYIWKPTSYAPAAGDYDGQNHITKAMLELKVGAYGLVEGNVFSGHFAYSSYPTAILLKNVIQENTQGPDNRTHDWTLRYNRLINASAFLTIASNPEGTVNDGNQVHRVEVTQWLVGPLGEGPWTWGNTPMTMNLVGGEFPNSSNSTSGYRPLHHVTLNNLTVLAYANSQSSVGNTGASNLADDTADSIHDLTIQNCVLTMQGQGFRSGLGWNKAALDAVCTTGGGTVPSWTCDHNGFLGDHTDISTVDLEIPGNTRITPYSLTSFKAQFANYDAEDYRIASGSPLKGIATDGGDPGADVDVLNEYLASVIEG